MQTNERRFDLLPAVRESVPVWLGIFGIAGSGKTRSALRVATGIQRITGGEIAVIDTEAKRAKHYAPSVEGASEPGKYTFRHLNFTAPFGPLDYLRAVETCVDAGARIIVIDSMSHEHEGPGGVLEMHDTETKRLAALWRCSENAAAMAGWIEPKKQRQRAINSMLQLGAHIVFCFRAQEKTKPPPKGERDVVKLGFMPIAGPAWVYEMTACCMLYPGAAGVPTWRSGEVGENMMIKRPDYLDAVTTIEGPLSEVHGEALARWARGGTSPAGPDPNDLRARLEAAQTAAEIKALTPQITKIAPRGHADHAMWAELVQAAHARVRRPTSPPMRESGDEPGSP